MQKRGQVSLFIIIGLIIVIAVSIVVYLAYVRQIVSVETTIPEDVAPVKIFVDSCVDDIAKEAVTGIGIYGGFITIPDKIARSPAEYLSLDKLSLVKLPYWFYNGEERIPTIEFMESEMEDYIDRNLPVCVDDFRVFRPFYEIDWEEPKSDVIIAENDVKIEVDYDLSIRSANGTRRTPIPTFSTEVPVRLRKIHRLAQRIMQRENQELFLENITMDLIVANPAIPFDGMMPECRVRRWFVRDIRNEIQSTLFYNLPRIRFENTANIEFEAPRSVYEDYQEYGEKLREAYDEVPLEPLENYGDRLENVINTIRKPGEVLPEDAYEFFHFLVDVGNTEDDLKAVVTYQPEWGMDILVEPSEQGMMYSNMGQGASEFLSFFCINLFHFAYDLIYPVTVLIKDETAFNQQGYSFRFAFPVMIKENEGWRDVTAYREFDSLEYDYDFCFGLSGEEVNIYGIGMREGIPNMELKDVNISYQCFNRRCYLGKTKAESGAHYRLKTQLPSGCTNPFIIARKEGYLEAKGQLVGDRIDLEMKSLQKMNMTVVKHVYQSTGEGYLGTAENIGENERITVWLSLNDPDVSFNQYVVYPSNLSEIELLRETAQYSLDIIFLKNNTFTGETTYVGGYSNNNLTITASELSGNSNIELHIFEYRPTPTKDDDTFGMVEYLVNGDYKETLKPVFK